MKKLHTINTIIVPLTIIYEYRFYAATQLNNYSTEITNHKNLKIRTHSSSDLFDNVVTSSSLYFTLCRLEA